LDLDTQKIWIEDGKYVLFFLQIKFDQTLPEKFNDMLEKKENKEDIDQVALAWVHADLLADSLLENSIVSFLHC
jgi:hypothetical protein